MNHQSSVSVPKVNPLSDVDFDDSDPNGWYRYVADSLVLTGLARRSGEAYAREVRILVHRFERPPFMLSEAEVRSFILDRHKKLKGSSQRILYRGLRFLYNDLFKYDWELLKAVRTRYEKKSSRPFCRGKRWPDFSSASRPRTSMPFCARFIPAACV